MSAKTEIYNLIKTKLLADTGVLHCALWNSQFDNMEQEDVFEFPCAFIEFATLDYVTKAKGLQEAEATIRIHLGFESLATEDLTILSLADEVHAELQGFEVTDLATSFDRTFEGQDTNHDNVTEWLMDYEFLLTDLSGHINNKLVLTNISELEVNPDDSTEATAPRLKGH